MSEEVPVLQDPGLEAKLMALGIDLKDLAKSLKNSGVGHRPEDDILNFENEVKRAKIRGDKWLETKRTVIDYFYPTGLKNEGYFTFRDMNICEEGTLDRILQSLDVSVQQRAHGKKYLSRVVN